MNFLLQQLGLDRTPPPPNVRRAPVESRTDTRGPKHRANVIARYCAALSRDKWRRTIRVADELGVSMSAVNKTLQKDYMSDLVERRKVKSKTGGIYFLWRLK